MTKILKENLCPKTDNNNSQILEGKANIIDKVIQKYIPESNDSKVKNIQTDMTVLTLKIDKGFNMLNDIGYRLPNLVELNLSGSSLESISDIGISFEKVEILNVSSCGLLELSGIICLKNLKKLYAANNQIKDLIDLEMCDSVIFIDLSNNLIEEEENLFFLSSCSSLEKVILSGNPIKIKDKGVLGSVNLVV